jgi:gliding motility-associated-like protein
MNRRIQIILFFLMTAGILLTGEQESGAQSLEGYRYRARLTAGRYPGPVSDSLSDFPVLFSHTDPLFRSVSNGGEIWFSDGRDFCFTDKDSVSILPFEIESYDPVTGSITAWIKASTDTVSDQLVMVLYFSNPDAVDQSQPADVWSNHYTAVWHLNNDPSSPPPQLTDATSYLNHGTAYNMGSYSMAQGKISGGVWFNGSDDYALMPANGFNPGGGTVEHWINIDYIDPSLIELIFSHRQDFPITDRVYTLVHPTHEWGTGMGDTYDLQRGSVVTTGNWYHMVIAWDGSEVTGYLNGTRDFGPVAYNGVSLVQEIYIMCWQPGQRALRGTLDELRVSDLPRDSVWVANTYENQAHPDQFVTVGPIEEISGDTATIYNVAGGGSYCLGDSGVSVVLSGSDPDVPYILVLNDTIQLDTLSGTGDSLTWFQVTQAGVYTIMAADPSDTVITWMSGSAEVVAMSPPGLFYTTESITCFGDQDGSISLTVQTGKPYSIQWNGPGGFQSENEILTGLSPGQYQVFVTDSSQCVSTSPLIRITEPALLEASVNRVNPLTGYEFNDGSIDLAITGGTQPYQVNWTGTDGYLSQDEDPAGMTVGYYDVMATDSHGCMDSIQGIKVGLAQDEDGLFIPEGFSPNGDGLNDHFVILGIEAYPDNELTILNRAGVKLYQRQNYGNDWDGTPETGAVTGGKLREGTYYYIFRYGDGNVRKGFIYINYE